MKLGRAWAAAAAGVALSVLVGCREERHTGAWMPPVLTEADIARYERTEEELNIGGKTIEELRGYFGVEQREVAVALTRAGFTSAQFLELGETVFLARHGRRVFVDLPRERQALAAKLAKEEWTGEQGAMIKAALKRESGNDVETSPLIERVLENVAALEAYEAKKKAKTAPGK
jgi:hypothetical protein